MKYITKENIVFIIGIITFLRGIFLNYKNYRFKKDGEIPILIVTGTFEDRIQNLTELSISDMGSTQIRDLKLNNKIYDNIKLDKVYDANINKFVYHLYIDTSNVDKSNDYLITPKIIIKTKHNYKITFEFPIYFKSKYYEFEDMYMLELQTNKIVLKDIINNYN